MVETGVLSKIHPENHRSGSQEADMREQMERPKKNHQCLGLPLLSVSLLPSIMLPHVSLLTPRSVVLWVDFGQDSCLYHDIASVLLIQVLHLCLQPH
jgi:hypothetical protein